MPRPTSPPAALAVASALAAPLALLAAGCSSQPAGGGSDAGADPDAGLASFEMELFEPAGHHFRFEVSDEQAAAMEETGFDPGLEDQYDIDGLGTYADDLIVTLADGGERHAFGKIELKLIGQSTARPWNRIPNLRVDMDEFQPGLRLGGVEHVRFNNGQVGGIYREAIALRLWGALGYPVPRTTFAWAEVPGQWGEGVRVPYTLVEIYKPGWCEHAMGGDCVNLWEAFGEMPELVGQCQFDVCDEARLGEMSDAVMQTPIGPGYVAATEAWIDWDAYRSFQCLSWITATGDDYIHNQNNLVVVEQADGRFRLLPYSTDISAGQSWSPEVSLVGFSQLALGCQNDPNCWTALLARCDELIADYDALDVVASIVEPAIAAVADAGMERAGDPARADELRGWYGGRSELLRADPVWDATPCVSDEGCADREDGKTSCQGVCVEPGLSCFDEPCPDGFFCDDDGACIPFDEPGPIVD
jgi:hypothetical protein